MAQLNRYRLRITLAVNATSAKQAEAVVRFLLRTGQNELTVEATEEPATPAGWTSIDAGSEAGFVAPRTTITQGPDTKSPDRPYWLTYRFSPEQLNTASRTMHFSSAAARTAWIAGLSQFATITGQGED